MAVPQQLNTQLWVCTGATPADDVLVGVISWGFGCGLALPSVYTSITVNPLNPSHRSDEFLAFKRCVCANLDSSLTDFHLGKPKLSLSGSLEGFKITWQL